MMEWMVPSIPIEDVVIGTSRLAGTAKFLQEDLS
jgi:hypothetical protein